MGAISAKKNFSFLCDYASISKDGKLSMNGIFEHINSKKFPVRHPLMYVVINISGASDKDIFTCEFTPKDNPQKKLCDIRGPVKIDPNKNFGFVGQLINVVFEKPGEYIVKFYIDNKTIGTHSLWVRQINGK